MRMMFFIDGENLVCRYQAMVKAGHIPIPSSAVSPLSHERDVYVWKPFSKFLHQYHCQITRAYYYTSVAGDENKVSSVIHAIKSQSIGYENLQTLYPVVFKKPKQHIKAKGVDIQMAVDILTHVYQDNLDIVCLFSGDGDYKPVLEEAIRRGKRIYVAAFSDGFNQSLNQLADLVVDLDKVYFKSATTEKEAVETLR